VNGSADTAMGWQPSALIKFGSRSHRAVLSSGPFAIYAASERRRDPNGNGDLTYAALIDSGRSLSDNGSVQEAGGPRGVGWFGKAGIAQRLGSFFPL